ncbi:MRN complex-interacting protein isoform X1 [Hemiscyllium ocellatum]|uniref:MRN complex-interacting protein isoform X1 n=1 Tax=Hemiscyllium ocellatum TaxID=170820 RepID=UPI0029665402|nr:MRN complex-interacting protein isoform X1 [Hemiscyllium ocellatum]
MAQRFQVLRCCFCKMYQVQQVKKSKKWNCKLCEAKQSVLKVYGQGSGADCRRHVQKLNMLQGERMQTVEAAACSIEEPAFANTDCNCQRLCTVSEQLESSASSRWSVYLDQTPINDASDEEGKEEDIVYTDRQQFQASVRNANRNRSKRKRGLCTSKQLYGNRTENNETKSSQTTMGHYLKCMNSTPTEGGSRCQEIRNRGSNNGSESNPVTSLSDKSQHDTITYPTKQLGSQASRWDRFLPHSTADDDEFFNQDTKTTEGYLTCVDSPCTDQYSTHSVVEDHKTDVDGFSDLKAACNGCPSSPQITGRVTEGTVTRSLTSLECVEEDMTTLSLPELTSDVHGLSNIACRAVTAVHHPLPTSMHDAPGVSRALKSGHCLPPQSLPVHQLSVYENPSTAFGFQAKQPSYFLSLFQTEEDFDDV